MKTVANAIILVLLVTSCISSQEGAMVHYKKESAEAPCREGTYSMKVPKGYKLTTLKGGHREEEKQYMYSDSAVIYVTDFRTSMLNHNNILSLEDSIVNTRLESIKLKSEVARSLGKEYSPDTLVLQGVTGEGLYWKDIRMGCLSIGYANVSEQRKSEFNKALASFRRK